jgi:hypothetical protein
MTEFESVCEVKKREAPRPGIEPGSPAWQAGILTTILTRNCDTYNQQWIIHTNKGPTQHFTTQTITKQQQQTITTYKLQRHINGQYHKQQKIYTFTKTQRPRTKQTNTSACACTSRYHTLLRLLQVLTGTSSFTRDTASLSTPTLSSIGLSCVANAILCTWTCTPFETIVRVCVSRMACFIVCVMYRIRYLAMHETPRLKCVNCASVSPQYACVCGFERW